MQRITLPNTGLTISRLGFGCASLTAHNDRAKAISVLNAAHELGVTHFDTARLYGMGQSESILGEFLQGKRDRVTVTTKFGLEAAGALASNNKLISFAKNVVRRSAFLKKLARKGGAGAVSSGKFTPEDAQRSLDTSLRELKTDHVDLFMLHCCTLVDACKEDLIAFLQTQVSKGTIRAFGPSTEYTKINGNVSAFPAAHALFQFESNTATRNLDSFRAAEVAGAGARDVITFAPIYAAKELALAAAANKVQMRNLSEFAQQASIDAANPDAIAREMLADALRRNARGGVLFASTSVARIKANIDDAFKPRTTEQQTAFANLIEVLKPLVKPNV